MGSTECQSETDQFLQATFTRPELPALEPSDGTRIVAGGLGDDLGGDSLKHRDQVLKDRVVVLQLPFALRNQLSLVRFQRVPVSITFGAT